LLALDYSAAADLLRQAEKQFPGDTELRSLREQVADVQQIVREARRLAADREFPRAAQTIETARARYPGDALLQRELQAVQEQAARAAAQRSEAIRQAVGQIEGLLDGDRLADARKLADASLQQFPNEPDLLSARSKVQSRIAEAERQKKRNQDLEALRRLDASSRTLTDIAQIPGIAVQVWALAAPYPKDQEFCQAAAAIEQQLSDMQGAAALLEREDFAAVSADCARYPGHPFFQQLKAEAERREKAVRLAQVDRQVAEEPDLTRQAALLDATLSFYPDEAALLRKSREVHGKLDQVETAVMKARQAEKEERWDDTLGQWKALGEIYREYAGLAAEIERAAALKEQARIAARERLVEQIRAHVNAGDYDPAAALLDRAERDYPADTDLQFFRDKVESVRASVREARQLADQSGFAEAVRSLEAALERNPGDALLTRELQEIQARAERQAELEREAARRAAEVRDAALHLRDLLARQDAEGAVQFVRQSAPHVQQDREIQALVAAAEQALSEQRLRHAVEELVAQALNLSQQSKFSEALQLLDRGSYQYPSGTGQIAAARAEVEAARAEWQRARDAERAEREAQEARRRAAEALAELTREVERLCGRRKFSAALRKIDQSGLTGTELATLRRRVESRMAPTEAPVQQPRAVPKAAWVGGAAAILALAGWGISTLLPHDGTLEIETSPAAAVSIDGSAGVPANDQGIASVRKPAGRHTVAVSKPGFENAQQTVDLKSGATNRVKIALNPARRVEPAPVPAIASLNPGSVVRLGSAFTLTVSGTGFQSGATVQWDGTPLPTAYSRATQLTAAVPARLVGTPGNAVITVVNPDSVASAPITLPINPSAPGIAGLSPDKATAGGPAFTLMLTGNGFQPGAAVEWNRERLSTTVAGATAARALVPAKLIANPGGVAVKMVNPGEVASSPVAFNINPATPTPVISGLNPASVPAGGPAFTLSINGSGFVPGAEAQWNRSALPTAVEGSTQLRVSVPANLIAAAGRAVITVINPGNVSSGALNLTINPAVPAPAISSLNPNSATAGAALTLTVNGSGFQSGATVEWNRSPAPATFVSAGQLRVAVPAGLLANPGNATVVVVNPGNLASAPVTFTINPPAPVKPVISGLNPSSATAGGAAFNLTVNGSGFVQGATVQWNRSPISTTFTGATQLRAAVPADLIANAGTASVTVVSSGNVPSGAVPFTINPPPVVTTAPGTPTPGTVPTAPAVNPDVDAIKATLTEYAAAYSQKNFRGVTSLWPSMPKDLRDDLQEAFARSDFTVQYSIEIASPPAIKGDDATVNIRSVLKQTLGKRASPPVQKNSVVYLHKTNSRWIIFRML
jgi:hypothetical protein